MANPIPGSLEWHSQVVEDILDPDRVIVDPHHHLWHRSDGNDYLLTDFWEDTGSGHRIEKTVFIECDASYRTEGPEHLKPLGETEFVTEIAERSRIGKKDQAKIAGIVAHADLVLGDAVEEVLNAHETAGKHLFRGIRHRAAKRVIPGETFDELYDREDFRKGMKVLGRMGLTYDGWHYHYQNKAFCEMAKAVPGTLMILDHFGTPLGDGEYADKREEIFKQWEKDIIEIAQCDNVVAKLGGLAMPWNGFGWDQHAIPPTSDEFVEAQKRYYLHTIECFGPDRCMFESNFPVDKRSISYHVLWNGLKKIVMDFSEDEKDTMFSGTASRVYRL